MDLLIDWSKSDKELFEQYFDFIKIKSTRQENIKKLNEFKKNFNNEVNIREHNQLLKLAIDYSEMKDRTVNLRCANWDNIKRVVKLYRQIIKKSKEDAENFCETMGNNTWEKGMSCDRYNLILSDKLKEIKKSYMSTTEKQALGIEEIWEAIEFLSAEDKKTILDKLTSEI